MEQDEFLTVEEAAQRLKVHDQTIRRWVRSGYLPGKLISRRAGWRISAAAVQRLLTDGPGEQLPNKTNGLAVEPDR